MQRGPGRAALQSRPTSAASASGTTSDAAAAPFAELLDELRDAQTALAVAEHRISFWRECPVTEEASCAAYRSYEAHETLLEARNVIDRVVEIVRLEVANTLRHTNEAKPKEAAPQRY